MRNSPILNLILFSICGSGWGCIATPSTVAQSSPSLSKPSTVIPVTQPAVASPRATPSVRTTVASPFLPGVTLPVFPGTFPIPTPTSQPTPVYPLVEVPTPGLRTMKVRNQPKTDTSVKKRRGTPTRVRRFPREQT